MSTHAATPTPPAPSAPSAASPGASAASRRVRAGSLALLTLAATTACVILLNVLAPRFMPRFDVTATGEHRLAPRTEKLLASTRHRYRVVLAGDFSRVDPRAAERVRDVLDQMTRRSSNVEVRTIDAGAAGGAEEFDTLLADLAEQSRAELDAQTRTVREAQEKASVLAGFLDDRLSPALEKIRSLAAPSTGATPAQQQAADYFRDLAAAARIGAQDLRAAGAKIDEPLHAKVHSVAVPATDEAAKAIRSVLSPLVEQLGQLSTQLRKLARSDSLPPDARDLTAAAADAIPPARDQAAIAADALDRLKRLDIRRVADVLSRGSAALVIGPPGVGTTAVPFEWLFPDAEWMDSAAVARADVGQRAEELFASAIGSLESPIKPVVVLVHGETRAFLELGRFVNRARDRLALRGIDVIEWATAVQDQPTELTRLNPDGSRPVVYVSLAPNTAVGSGTDGSKPGVERAKKLGAALKSIADAGHPLLLSMSPSVLQTYGQPDPTVEVLDRFGLHADTARPIMTEQLTPQGRSVASELVAQAVPSEHPIATAVKGLPMEVEWPIGLTSTPPDSSSATVQPLFLAAGDGRSWAESQWAGMWATRGKIDRESDLPTFDSGRDDRPPTWMIAAAAEKPNATGRQRLVAVGANTWFMDERSQATAPAGRGTNTPGNMELLEAAVYWLAGQDGLIAQSPQARAVALVRPLNPAQLRIVRVSLVVALPLLILVLGVVYRWVRG